MPLDNLIDQLNKKFGKKVLFLGSDPKFKITRIPTGSYSIDYITGGGIPQGRIIEVYGNYSTGKSRFALQIIKWVQRNLDKICVYVNVEDTFDEKFAKKNGVDLNKLIVFRPDVGEDVVNFVYTIIKEDVIGCLIIDSLAALLPASEANNDAEKERMGLAGKLTSSLLRKLNAGNTNGTTVILINQVRDKIGVMFGKKETTPGGRASQFFSSLRLEFRRGETLKTVKGREGVAIGRKIHVLVDKDKTNPNEQATGTFDYYFKKMRIDNEQELLDLGRITGLVDFRRGIISYGGTVYKNAEEFKNSLVTDKVLRKDLWDKIMANNKNVQVKKETEKKENNAGSNGKGKSDLSGAGKATKGGRVKGKSKK